jgi:hypothetical protein
MTVFLILAGNLTCGFFFYVLVQFHKELKRREFRSIYGYRPKCAHSPALRFRSRRGPGGRGFEAVASSAKVPLVETAVSVKPLVPRDT